MKHFFLLSVYSQFMKCLLKLSHINSQCKSWRKKNYSCGFFPPEASVAIEPSITLPTEFEALDCMSWAMVRWERTPINYLSLD